MSFSIGRVREDLEMWMEGKRTYVCLAAQGLREAIEQPKKMGNSSRNLAEGSDPRTWAKLKRGRSTNHPKAKDKELKKKGGKEGPRQRLTTGRNIKQKTYTRDYVGKQRYQLGDLQSQSDEPPRQK